MDGILFKVDVTADIPSVHPGFLEVEVELDNSQSPSVLFVPPGDANWTFGDSEELFILPNGSSMDTPTFPLWEILGVALGSGTDQFVVRGDPHMGALSIEVNSDTFGGGTYNTGWVEGYVTNAETGANITGGMGYVDVFDPNQGMFIGGAPVMSDGYFYIGGLPEGNFELDVHVDMFDPYIGYPVNITVSGAYATIPLYPFSNTLGLYGYIEDVQTMMGVDSANVELVNSGLATVTDSYGSFMFNDVPAFVDEQLKASKIGYKNTYSELFQTGNVLDLFLPLVPEAMYNQIATDLTADTNKGVIVGDIWGDMGPVAGATVAAYQIAADGSIGTTAVGRVVYSSGTPDYMKTGEGGHPSMAPVWDSGMTSTGSDGMFIIVDLPLGKIEVQIMNTSVPYLPLRTRTFKQSICSLEFDPAYYTGTGPMPLEIYELSPPAAATEGGVCVLYGSGFEPGMTAKIGGQYNCTVSVIDSMECELSVPPMPAGDYSGIEVILPDGRMSSINKPFFVRPLTTLSAPVSVPPANQATGTPLQWEYRLISIPAFYVKGFDHFFEDILGPYDPYVWRAFGWDPWQHRYIEYNEAKAYGYLTFEPGMAMWVISWVGAEAIPQGFTLSPDQYHCTLWLGPGWNMIGNPFSSSYYWGSGVVRNPFSEKENSLEDPAVYDGSLYTCLSMPYQYDGAGGYIPADHLEPGVGYWVNNKSGNEVAVILGNASAAMGKASFKTTGVLPDAAYAQKDTPPAPPGGDVSAVSAGGGGGGGCFISTIVAPEPVEEHAILPGRKPEITMDEGR